MQRPVSTLIQQFALPCALALLSASQVGASDVLEPAEFAELDMFFLMEESSDTSLHGSFDITDVARDAQSLCAAIEHFRRSVTQHHTDWRDGYYLSGEWVFTADLVFINDRNEYNTATSLIDYGFLVISHDALEAEYVNDDVPDEFKEHLDDCE